MKEKPVKSIEHTLKVDTMKSELRQMYALGYFKRPQIKEMKLMYFTIKSEGWNSTGVVPQYDFTLFLLLMGIFNKPMG